MTAMLFSNNASSRLYASIDAITTSIRVQNGDGDKFPTPTGDGSDFFTVTLEDRRSGQIEIVKCTGRSGDILNVVRAQESTVAQAFAMGATVSNRLTAATMSYLANASTATNIGTGAEVFAGAAVGTGTMQFRRVRGTGIVTASTDANGMVVDAPVPDWAAITNKPATFPPTLPIPSSGVTGLDAAQAAQDALIAVKEDKANKGVASGYASLDVNAKVPAAQLPAYVDDVVEYPNIAAFPVTGTAGLIYVALDTNKVYRWSGSAYIEISPSPGSTDAVPEGSVNLYFTTTRASAAAPVQSVAGRTGAVVLTKDDVGLGNVDNTSDANKPVSAATQAALDQKAPLVSPTFTGDPKAPTPATADNDTSIATTAFVKAQGYLPATSYTATDVLAKLVTVDGSGSGLDADLLDGQNGTYYTTMANQTGTISAAQHGNLPGGALHAMATNTVGGFFLDAASDGNTYVRKNGAWALGGGGGGGGGTSMEFTYNNNIAEPPGGGQVRFNNATVASATRMWISFTTAPGADVKNYLLYSAKKGAKVFIQDKDDSTRWGEFKLLTDPVNKTTYGQWDVEVLGVSGTALASGQRVFLGISTAGGGASVIIADAAPAGPVPGTLWFESDSGNTFIWYEDGTSNQWVQVNAGVAVGASADPGAISWFARSSPPVGWVKANGAAVSRTAYSILFAAIGTSFGAGDGSTTFNLPDLRGEFVRGWDDARGIDVGRSFGSAQAAAVESHTHSFTGTALGTHNHTASSGTESADHTHTFSGAANSGTGSANHDHTPAIGGVFASNTGGTGWLTGAAGNVIYAQNNTNAAGAAHVHYTTISGTSDGRSAVHTHAITNVAISAGTPSGTVGNFGGAETRPRNVALLACVKY